MAWRPNTKYFGDMRIRKRGAIKSFVKSRLGNQASLKIVLNHGDIMIMHGALMQRYYEVSDMNSSHKDSQANTITARGGSFGQVAICYHCPSSEALFVVT